MQRREWRRRRGPLRDGQEAHVKNSRKVSTKELWGHFKRLLKPLKLEGLWAWAEIATALHTAGVPVLSGTNPVEQFWAGLLHMLPAQGRCLSLRWFRVLAGIAFLRHNHRIFTKGALPSWAEGDSLLGHRLDVFTAMCEVLRADEQQADHLQAVFDPFVL